MAPIFDAAVDTSFFESMLLLALDEFRERGVSVALLEVAIGGYHDVVSLIPGATSLLATAIASLML